MKIAVQHIERLMKAAYMLLLVTIIALLAVITIYYVRPIVINNQSTTLAPSWKPKSMISDLPSGEEGGYQLITKTSHFIGPLASDSSMRYAGNNLTCNNCHLDAGRRIGSGSFVGVINRFPQFRGRENKIGTIEERIDGCMQRSMNGKVLPKDSREMRSMIAYMAWLSEDVPKNVEKMYKGYVKIEIPEFAADTLKGKQLYVDHCMLCHGENAEGKLKSSDIFDGYTYPPIAGGDTYNDGAGMNRVITAAQFIKGNMPFGATYDAPRLTDEEAYHIASYINVLPRPEKSNKAKDFPDLLLKPASTPYGPWADEFSPQQHKFGPFLPIIKYYKEEHDIVKSK